MSDPTALFTATFDCALCSAAMRLDRACGPARIDAVARSRLDELVAHARERSPLYRERYAGLPARPALADLPPVGKRELMARFDDWATDRRIARAPLERFLADPQRAGDRWLGAYTVWTSSGTTGEPGIFVQDDAALAVYDALVMAQSDPREWGPRELARCATAGGGMALVVATGAPHPGIVAWRRIARLNPTLAGRAYPITLPLPELVAALARHRPAFLATYPTMALLLARERLAGRLPIAPAMVWCGGECMSQAAREAVAAAFDCPVHDEYGAAESFSIAAACAHGAMHLHADWVLLEPVDRLLRPVPPGTRSHTVLLTNLANRVQPIIRYDLGDSVRVLRQPCPCGNPLPAIEVHGRTDDTLSLASGDGVVVPIVPLALESVVEEALGAVPFQLVAEGARALRLRLARTGPGATTPARRRACRRALLGYLASQGLGDVRVVDDAGEPAIDARSGKLRRVIAAGPPPPSRPRPGRTRREARP
ncbi:MAG: phenylacetate--CoA ligase family protein [Burkholderiales bacterium]|nr:phenylacetate--CoA ligase family protein [Burkholderiales bacterium]GIK85649.1 MAG: coenzyme F390 synthetase [Betaproteobacteria bacterium]